jgi:predicted enzyme related to lactoylglutathione lyase
MPSSFCYSELHTKDLTRAKAFYSELFGWKFEDLPVPGMQYAMVHTGGEQGSGAMNDAAVPPMWLTYINVDNVIEATARAAKLGAKVLTTKTEVKDMGWFAVIDDPTGARLALWEPAKK